jgi:methylase of polypeptide subunit release factors
VGPARKEANVASQEQTIHEVDFCTQVASAANALIAGSPAMLPFHEARVEGYGTGKGKRKRKDLRFYDRDGKLVLCGEVKLPGTAEGGTPYDDELLDDADRKAGNATPPVRFFFTWNVNLFVLWDRSLFDRPALERRVNQWPLGRILPDAQTVARDENLQFIKTHFLPDLLRDLADIISGRRRDWAMPPDDVFIQTLNSHLDWPIQLTGAYIRDQAKPRSPFDLRAQRWMTDQDWTFVRTPPEEWAQAVDNMAKTLAYVWANRLIFYKALRTRFPDLPRLEFRKSLRTPDEAISILNQYFKKAVDRSGDYEPLLMPEVRDWATELVFHPPGALDAWRAVLRNIESIDFAEVPSDVVGRIFQKLIGPEERHRYGQHFTGDDVVDLINAFCIRNAGDAVLDPACGSGSFLVRAYYRKRALDPTRPHLDLIGELFGCDIAMYPAHLATLNLAAREINEEANYPRIARRDFFDFAPPEPFTEVPDNAGGRRPVPLPALDAVVGNPPYVRQEMVEKREKARYGRIAAAAWPGLRLAGRSDLHCYFWPGAARLLKEGGYFGFLTSSSWLDVEYGFPLQGWLLRNFRILAVMESAAEPWFEDARIKTCVTILQRCDDEAERMGNRVRFVRFDRKLSEIIGAAPTPEKEGVRQAAVEALRGRILNAEADWHDEQLRIIVKTQEQLWRDGLRAGAVLDSGQAAEPDEGPDRSEPASDDSGPMPNGSQAAMFGHRLEDYRAGKWGRYVRAPDLYFEFMRRFGGRFVPLGEIADIRFGLKSGCDAFFMPRDVSAKNLAAHKDEREFRHYADGASRADVESGKLKVIRDGVGFTQAIEAKYLVPEVHSPMVLTRPVVRAADLDRLVLLVGEPMPKLKAESPRVWSYLRYGMTGLFPSGKSGSLPVPKRPTCASREPWYDLTKLVHPGIAFWPMAQQYRHIIAANPERLVCNHRLFDLAAPNLSGVECESLVAVLNSTLVGLSKNFYGRYTGTEGSLDTEVLDVRLIEVPDPRGASRKVAKRLAGALKSMSRRDTGRLVEEQLMACHSPQRARRIAAGPLVLPQELQQPDRRELDDAVLELLGVTDPAERSALIDRLYEATARHFREIRVVEIAKMEQRAKSDRRRFDVFDLAGDIWDAASLEDATPLPEWIGKQGDYESMVIIPEERPARLADNPMFAPNTVYFGKARKTRMDCASRGQAELVARIANLGVAGEVRVPADVEPCLQLLSRIDTRMEKAGDRFARLAESRTGDPRVQEQLREVLHRWFVLGGEAPKRGQGPEAQARPDDAQAEAGSEA